MDSNFLGIGFWEIVLVLILALFFLGPARIVGFARALGRLMNNIKKASSDITTQITKEAEEQQKSVKDAAGSLKNEAQGEAKGISQIAGDFLSDLRGEVKDISATVNQVAGEIKEQGQAIADAANKPVNDIKVQDKSAVKPVSQIPVKTVNNERVIAPVKNTGPGAPG